MDYWRDDSPISYRRLWVLIEHLPPSSAFWRAVHQSEDWTHTDYILASLYDAAAIGNWQRGGDSHAEKPQPFPRPGDEARKRDKLLAVRDAYRARQAARERGEI